MHRLRYSQQQTDGGKPVENSVPPQAPASMIALITDFHKFSSVNIYLQLLFRQPDW